MDDTTLLSALILGVVEGLTEFLPVSSTGHLILIGDLLGFQGPPGRLFEVVIQLGAILAICVVYFQRLWHIAVTLPTSRESRRFVIAILLAFLPAAVIGVMAHGFIKSVLFSPYVVCVALIVGGIAILLIERNLPTPRHFKVEQFSPRLALGIGFVQTLAMIPGVSRSGATILGALLMGVERKTAAEFSFFLAIPTMAGAVVYDTYKNFDTLTSDGSLVIAIGFVAAFLAALVVVKSLVAFVSRFGFTPFGWYRIALGTLMLVILAMR
ncbi:UDP pyrophosphate phosphatase [Skermanella stibiiresistens SB22]|uniref:Undecaprenyl-diphosphatase n=1 Tax=Skermanella stibiiresistens SB22 TaxID=1385369 RepID=W9H971_9PROT|nr:undecaprenyl-diphosphate phosphatase [Skermanella stibiiresistens]EWY40363.1 UDP pyrophosphate phosphatase [Skermanella stibiiresistens SB22]